MTDIPDYSIEVELWASVPSWDIDQMSWLAVGIDPMKARLSPEHVPPTPDLQQVSRKLIYARKLRGDNSEASLNPKPIDAIALIQSIGCKLPSELVEAVRMHAAKPIQTEKSRRKADTTKEQNTIATALLVLAIDKFNHDPNGKSAAAELANTMKDYQAGPSENTLRSHLKKAWDDLDGSAKDRVNKKIRNRK